MEMAKVGSDCFRPIRKQDGGRRRTFAGTAVVEEAR